MGGLSWVTLCSCKMKKAFLLSLFFSKYGSFLAVKGVSCQPKNWKKKKKTDRLRCYRYSSFLPFALKRIYSSESSF